MNRLKKELYKREIVYDCPDFIDRPEDDMEIKFLFNTADYIVVGFFSAVIDPILKVYDRNLRQIADQNLYPETMFLGGDYNNKWCVTTF